MGKICRHGCGAYFIGWQMVDAEKSREGWHVLSRGTRLRVAKGVVYGCSHALRLKLRTCHPCCRFPYSRHRTRTNSAGAPIIERARDDVAIIMIKVRMYGAAFHKYATAAEVRF